MATLYAKIIMSEWFTNQSDASFKQTNVGGVAGGKKYVLRGMLFKAGQDAMLNEDPLVRL